MFLLFERLLIFSLFYLESRPLRLFFLWLAEFLFFQPALQTIVGINLSLRIGLRRSAIKIMLRTKTQAGSSFAP